MRLLVLGATGRTGRELVDQALTHGHQVTALVRDPSKLARSDEGVQAVVGSATDAAAVGKAVAVQDAVLCALGPSSPTALLSSDLMVKSTNALIASMKRHDVSRLVMLSALGAGRSGEHAPVVQRLVFRTLLRQVGKDKADAEELLYRTDLDWTVVYPPSLANGPRTGSYRHGEALKLKGMPKITRADLAEFMIAQLTDSSYSRRPVVVSS